MSPETEVTTSAATLVRMELPRGDSAETATVVRLYVAPGDPVEIGTAVCLLHTDRFLFALPATASGIVERCLVDAGAQTAPGAPLLSIVPDAPPAAITQQSAEQVVVAAVPRATPLARAIAAAHDFDLGKLAVERPGRHIRAADVRAALGAASNGYPGHEYGARQAPVPTADKPDSIYTAGIPAYIIQDHQPQALTAVEVDCEQDADGSAARIIYATLQALIEHPWLNSRWTDDGVLLYGRIDLGLWRDTANGRSLMVLPGAADLSLAAIERTIATSPPAIEDTRSESASATFTIWLAGAPWWSEPIIPVGSSALLYIGSSERRVVVWPTTERLMIRSRRLLALSYDARHIAQPEADSLLNAVRKRVERRQSL